MSSDFTRSANVFPEFHSNQIVQQLITLISTFNQMGEGGVITEIARCRVQVDGMKSCLLPGLPGIWQETTGFQAEDTLIFPDFKLTST